MVITTMDVIAVMFVAYSVILFLVLFAVGMFLRISRKGREIQEKQRMDQYTSGYHNNFGKNLDGEDITMKQMEEAALKDKEDNKAYESLNKCQEAWESLSEKEKETLDATFGTEREETYNKWFKGCMQEELFKNQKSIEKKNR